MKNINLRRLQTSLREYWLLNRSKLISIPPAVFLLYMLITFWYGTPLFNKLYQYYDYQLFVESLARYKSKQASNLALITLPLYLILCTIPYFKMLKTTVHGALSPITRGERMITLWLGNLVIILLVLLSFFLTDVLFVSTMKSLYLEDVMAYKEEIGDLYFRFSDESYFVTVEFLLFKISTVASLIFACVYQLAALFFRRFSIPAFGVMMLAYGFIFYQLLITLYKGVEYRIEDSDFTPIMMTTLMISVGLGLVITTYFKLKEKEIY